MPEGSGTHRHAPWRRVALVGLVLGALMAGAGLLSAATAAENSRVTGSAYGYFTDVSLFGGPSEERGPEPLVELEPDASNSPQTAQVDSAEAVYGPATVFTATGIEVRTEGTLGGSVSSSTTIQGPTEANQVDPIHYGSMESSCTADGTGPTGEVTITDGQVVSTSGTEPIPTNPEPNHTVRGKVPNVEDNFRVVFNEQTTNDDGTITVTAAHMYLEGPIAVGEAALGQSVCGIRGAAAGAAQEASPEATATTAEPGPTPTPSPTLTDLGAAASDDTSLPWVPVAVAAVVVLGLAGWAGVRWRRGGFGGG